MTTTEGTGGGAFANKKCPQGRAFEQFFQNSGSDSPKFQARSHDPEEIVSDSTAGPFAHRDSYALSPCEGLGASQRTDVE